MGTEGGSGVADGDDLILVVVGIIMRLTSNYVRVLSSNLGTGGSVPVLAYFPACKRGYGYAYPQELEGRAQKYIGFIHPDEVDRAPVGSVLEYPLKDGVTKQVITILTKQDEYGRPGKAFLSADVPIRADKDGIASQMKQLELGSHGVGNSLRISVGQPQAPSRQQKTPSPQQQAPSPQPQTLSNQPVKCPRCGHLVAGASRKRHCMFCDLDFMAN